MQVREMPLGQFTSQYGSAKVKCNQDQLDLHNGAAEASSPCLHCQMRRYFAAARKSVFPKCLCQRTACLRKKIKLTGQGMQRALIQGTTQLRAQLLVSDFDCLGTPGLCPSRHMLP